MKIARIAVLLVLAGALLAAAAFVARAPEPPPPGSDSERRLAPGPHRVGSHDLTLVDSSRPTAANGDFAGAPERTLEATLWYPEAAPRPHPLLVYSHGFMSRRRENVPLAELLASHGYVVASVDYPLTNGRAPGGPNVADAVNQPGDVSFLIDSLLAMPDGERPFEGPLDAERIGALGLSLGGLTTTLAAFHPKLRDPRIRAALSIAGPGAMFGERFFATADVPFLMIAGSADAIVDYGANAAPIPGRIRHGGLLRVEGASHAGFAALADGFPLRLLGNPDALGCRALAGNLELRRDENPFANLGGPEDGLVDASDMPLPCANGAPDDALPAGRQLMLTRLAALAFFESEFAPDPAERAVHARFLRETLPAEFAEAGFEPASR